MNTPRDQQTRVPDRRQFLASGPQLAGGLLAAGAFASTAAAASLRQDGDAPVDAEYLFVQTAKSAALAGGTLTLVSVSPVTIYFSDRPERVAGHVETEHFIEAMLEDHAADSFNVSPPNGALSLLDGEFIDEVVVTLQKPELKDGNLIYPIVVLDGMEDIEGGPATLFIDPIGRPASPTSVAGVHRRTRRRTRRRVTHHNW